MGERMSFLARREKGRRMEQALRQQLAAKLNTRPEAIKFVELEQSDRIRAAFFHRWSEFRRLSITDEYHERHESHDRAAVALMLAEIKRRVSDLLMYLVYEGAEYAGVVEVSLHRAIDQALSVCECEGEDLLVTSDNAGVGLTVESFIDRLAPVYCERLRLNWWCECNASLVQS
jgi:hypothetical protein